MKRISQWTLCAIATTCAAVGTPEQPVPKHPQLLILDSEHTDAAYRHALTALAQAAGFRTTYQTTLALHETDLQSFDAVFLIISGEFLAHQEHPLTQDTIKAVGEWYQHGHRLLALLLPNQAHKPATIAPLLHALQIDLNDKQTNMTNKFIAAETYRNKHYRTSLFGPKSTTPSSALKNIQNASVVLNEKTATLQAAFLPWRTAPTYPTARNVLPLGLYLSQPNDNHLFISREAFVSFADLHENYRLCPVDRRCREALLQALNQTISELYTVLTRGDMHSVRTAPLPRSLTHEHSLRTKLAAQGNRASTVSRQYQWIEKKGIACGWMDVPPDEEPYDMQKLVDAIEQANLNLLWIRFNPEDFLLGPQISRGHKKREKRERAIADFRQRLVQTCIEKKKRLPKIFVGLDITNNYHTLPVTTPASTMYGATYSKVPSPLDFENHWKVQLLDAFDKFVELWHTLDPENRTPISGIFLDLEMYHAPKYGQPGMYTSSMDLSDTAWKIYTTAITDWSRRAQATSATTPAERIAYLHGNQAFRPYFQILEHAAYALGQRLRTQLHKKYPQLMIAAYLPTLPESWFYRGLLAGLCTKKKPIILATLNNDFYNHHDYLKQIGINAYHMTILLLSRLQQPREFEIIPKLWRDHDGIWFNRISWIAHGHRGDRWWSVESSPLEPEKLCAGIAQQVRKARAQQKGASK